MFFRSHEEFRECRRSADEFREWPRDLSSTEDLRECGEARKSAEEFLECDPPCGWDDADADDEEEDV